MLGADAMAKCLVEENVGVVFGYPGVAICPFFNSMLSVDIERVLVRTEQNAAHMASGYARISGKVGVCVATSGPGHKSYNRYSYGLCGFDPSRMYNGTGGFRTAWFGRIPGS